MKAFVFPGQGAQFVGMGKDLYENSALAKELFEKANNILGYKITDIMFNGTDEDLRQTKVTQPAVFLHSVISALASGENFQPDMTAGHSLGEFSALVAAGALSFEDGLRLVYARAMAMQKACELQPSTMAAIIALPDATVEEICAKINAEGDICVAEADESDGSIKNYHPYIALINNISHDHVSIPELVEYFTEFAKHARHGIVVNADCPLAGKLEHEHKFSFSSIGQV